MAEVSTEALVDGRYRLGERIGSGGMADVHRAEDTHLGRSVAIKLLHRRFARDPAFVERFRREASSAAGLQHPHVVNVFDRGEHDGTYYIAMEHLDGRTLKQVITEDAPLPQERAIDLGIQILQAAGFAHRHGVIHRDFKPHNVIVDERDGVKVTDFGIARAGASEITETGSILGTAQYLSPEQAQGGGTEAGSDIYSIGVILYELLCARLPFEGESAVAIAVKHVTEDPPRAALHRPDVHPAVEAAVMKSLAKDPKQRFASADEFAAALQSARAALAMGDDGQGTAVWAALAAADVDEEEKPPRRRRRLLWLLIPLLLLGALLAFLLLRGPPQVPVPDVVGDTLSDAQPQLEDAGFAVEVEREHDQAPLNDVVEQDPPAEVEVDEGAPVTLVVSAGPVDVKVPDIVGLPREDALKRLERAGLQANVDEQSSTEVEAGLVVATVPEPGIDRPRGSAIDVILSSGPRQVEVPGVVGESRDGAAATIEGQGLTVAVDEVDSSRPADEVIDQDPAGGTTVDEGTQVTLTVSLGPPRVSRQRTTPAPARTPDEPETAPVPGVVGASRPDASAQLRAAGFGVATSYETTDDPGEDGVVLRQSPGAGTRLEAGASVQIVVGRFEEPPPEDPGGGGGGDPTDPTRAGDRSSPARSA